MGEPTPCPQCRAERVWARANFGAGGGISRVAYCPVCARTDSMPRPSLSRFVAGAPAPALMQRIADDFEDLASVRYRRRRQILATIEDAARRADAAARLEADLRRL
ncbi:MAG TPA: hypothetical protein VGQ42_03590 [Candidatus Dormibacteraeota bacterium]|jgi:hypothetical protein|nr:hypothetical protein [Candidatus Dormibacteraeota bacterium]